MSTFNYTTTANLTDDEYTLIMQGMGLDAETDIDPVNGVGYLAVRSADGGLNVHSVVDWPSKTAEKDVWFSVKDGQIIW